jgi:MSHA biogenesis protein MshQ
MKKYESPDCLVLTVVVTILMTHTADAAWYDTNWQYRKRITIDNNQVDANLSGFPVLINLATDVDLAANAQNDGDDILFTSSDEISKIPHEIELFDGGTGQLIAWVNVPSVSASVDTDIYIYYGNASVGSQQDVANVWDANFVKVLHLKETPNGTLDELNDSTGSGNHGQTFSMGAGNSVIAQIGRGLNFVRGEALDQIRVYDSASLDGTADEGTLEFWINFVSAPPPSTYYLIMVHSLRFSTGNGMEHAWRADDNFFMYPNAGDPGGQTWSGTSSHGFAASQWHHVVWRWRRVPGQDHDLFTDGNPIVFDFADNSANWTLDTAMDDWYYGGSVERNDRSFDGSLDEIRVSNIMRSDGWISTEHNNQSDPDNFYALGPQTMFPLDFVKRAFWPDGTPIPTGATIPGGVEFKYLLYINNYGAARSDVSVRDLLDPIFQYQPGTIQADNSIAECAVAICTPAEEQTIFATVTGAAFLSDAADGDTASYSGGTASVDAGDGNVANAQLNINADAVWAISFSVKLP